MAVPPLTSSGPGQRGSLVVWHGEKPPPSRGLHYDSHSDHLQGPYIG